MLRLLGGQVESFWDEVLPAAVRELPEDLARLDGGVVGSVAVGAIADAWEAGSRGRGRPSIALASFVQLIVVKQRTGWGSRGRPTMWRAFLGRSYPRLAHGATSCQLFSPAH